MYIAVRITWDFLLAIENQDEFHSVDWQVVLHVFSIFSIAPLTSSLVLPGYSGVIQFSIITKEGMIITSIS